MEEGTFAVERLMNQYRESGFDEDSLAMAKKDMSRNVDVKVVDCYMNIRLSKSHRLLLAEAFHKGIPLSLGEKLARKNEDFLKEVMLHLDEQIPFEVIEEITTTCKNAKHAQIAFKDYKEELQMLSAGTIKKGNETETPAQPVQTVHMDTVEENHIPATEPDVPEKPKTERRRKKHVRTVFDPPEVPEKSEIKIPEVPELHLEKEPSRRPADPSVNLNDELIRLMEEFLKVNKLALSVMAGGLMRNRNGSDPVPPYVPHAFDKMYEKQESEKLGKKETNKPNNDEMIDRVEVSKDAEMRSFSEAFRDEKPATSLQVETTKRSDTLKRMQAYAGMSETRYEHEQPASAAEPVRHTQPARNLSPEYVDGYTRMILMPNGALIPLEIEKTDSEKKRGFFGLASRMFGKKSPQRSLLNQLIDRRLKSDQLKMIQRAVRSNIPAKEVRELIESAVPADEMGNIIDVLVAEQEQRAQSDRYAEVV